MIKDGKMKKIRMGGGGDSHLWKNVKIIGKR